MTNNYEFKPRITLLSHTRSGCNCRALYDNIPAYISKKYDVQLLMSEFYSEAPEDIVDSEIVVTTHRDYFPRKHQFNIELWHGFGPKTLGAMEVPLKSIRNSREYLYSHFKHLDVFASYSPFCSAMQNAGFHASGEVYQVTGMPRNDMLFTTNGRENLQRVFDENFYDKKIVFYMPTWRDQYVNLEKSDGSRTWNNIFDLEEFDLPDFGDFLVKNNLVVIVKLHPFEESLVIDKISSFESKNIYFLTNSLLEASNIQLYELLNAGDLLVTDYSSVYMDFLLLNKPVMFIPSDLKKYEETRGFWLTPYEFWAPGPKVRTQVEFEVELNKSLYDKNYYKQQRDYVKSIVHHYQDDQSSSRVWNVIDDLWNGRLKKNNHTPYSIDRDILIIRDAIKSQIYDMFNKGYLNEAEVAITQYEQDASDDQDIFTLKATLSFLKEDINQAIVLLREAFVLNPLNTDNLFNLGFMYKVAGDISKSTYYFSEFIQKATNDDKYGELFAHAIKHLEENRAISNSY